MTLNPYHFNYPPFHWDNPMAHSVYDVRLYGATGDGTTDDTDAIQAAIDACNAAGGGTVYLPQGTYIVSDTDNTGNVCLYMRDNVRLTGAGIGSTIIKVSSAEVNPVSIIENETSINDAEISHIEFDGNKGDGTTGRIDSSEWGVVEHEGIDLKSPTRIFLHHLYVHDCGTDAIDIDSGADCVLDSLIIENNGGCGIHAGGTAASNIGWTISNIISRGNSHYRMQSPSSSVRRQAGGLSIVGYNHQVSNFFSENDERGIVVVGNTNCTYSNIVINEPGAGSNITSTSEVDPATIIYNIAQGEETAGVAPTGYGHGLVIDEANKCSFDTITVEMRSLPSALRAHSLVIQKEAVQRCTFSNLNLSGGAPVAQISGCDALTFTGCLFANARSEYNVIIQENVEPILFNGCYSYKGAGGFRAKNDASEVTFTNCFIDGSTGDGISLQGTVSNCTVINCVTSGNTDAGIEVHASGGVPSGCVIINNNVSAEGSNPIKNGGTDTVIAGNIGATGILSLSATTAVGAVHSGNDTYITGTAAATYTLPEATGSGNKYRFIIGQVNTNGNVFITADTTNCILQGSVNILDLDAATQSAYAAGGSDDTLTLNGTTTGGQIGDFVEFTDVATDVWMVHGQLQCPTGSNPSTPFSNT